MPTAQLKIFRGDRNGGAMVERVPLEPPPAELKGLLEGEVSH